MTGPSWQVPTELVRVCADTAGLTTLIQLQGRLAAFAPHTRIEMLPGRFVAHVPYQLPGYGGVTDVAVVSLAVFPRENGSAAA